MFLITLYQKSFSYFLRLLFGPGCRFTPSCSEYAKEAIAGFGIFYGTILAVKRLSRCHPWGSSGFDPIPDKL
jgi:hypothetical protein